jgi:DNA-binding CsgD family transcriptional regulator
LNSAFSRFAADQLTPREQLIVSMILRGHSSLSISLHLGIAEGTVKNHRKHLYCKLGISSQSELFHLFVNFVLSHTAKIPLAHAGSKIPLQEAFTS